MAITTSTPIAEISFNYRLISKIMNNFDVRTDEDIPQSIGIGFDNSGNVYSGSQANFDILQQIHDSDAGFVDRDGNRSTFVFHNIPNASTLADLRRFGYQDPFSQTGEEAQTVPRLLRMAMFGDDYEFTPVGHNVVSSFNSHAFAISTITWDVIPKAKFLTADFAVEINGRLSLPVHLDRSVLEYIGYVRNSDWPREEGDPVGTPLKCIMVHGNRYNLNDREVLFNPSHFHADSLRAEEDPMLFMFFRESSDGEGIIGVYIRFYRPASSNPTVYILRGGEIVYEA